MPRDHRRRHAPVFLLLVCLVGAACSPAEAAKPSVAAPADSPTAAPTPKPTPKATTAPTATPAPTPTPDVLPADLDGLIVQAELAHRQPLAISIDDARVARPQSGFNGASIVWHAPADGYEARYLLVFQEGDSSAVGPVRSARPYLAHWAAELRAALGHYGGDEISRSWIRKYTKNLLWSVDGIGAGNAAYHRTRDRKAPHNAYTSTAAFRKVATKLGSPVDYGAELHVRPFRDDSPVAERGTKQTIAVPFRTVNVAYRYDAATNRYNRSLDGKAHVDRADGKQVTARTVIVLFMAFRLDSRIEPGHARPVLAHVGTGKGLVFTEGKTVSVTWSKKDNQSPTLILGPDGTELPLVRGRIFIEVVPIGTRVSS